MAISNTQVIRAQCDACPQVVYADAPAQPKGLQGVVRQIDGNGKETNARWFACQVNHVGAAIKRVLTAAKSVSVAAVDYDHPVAAIDGTNGGVASDLEWDRAYSADQDADPEAAQG